MTDKERKQLYKSKLRTRRGTKTAVGVESDSILVVVTCRDFVVRHARLLIEWQKKIVGGKVKRF